MIIDYFIFFRAKRRERDNARKAQSRRWYYEKADWIVSDEIEDDELDLSEEEVILEQSLEVPTVKVDRVLTFKSILSFYLYFSYLKNLEIFNTFMPILYWRFE